MNQDLLKAIQIISNEGCPTAAACMQAYSPLGKGQREVMQDRTVTAVARRLGRTNAQVLIRWSLQQGFICLPKSSNAERQRANLDVFSFELSPEDMQVSMSPGLLCNMVDAQEDSGV